MDIKWTAFIDWCTKNPHTTIERLEIVNGKPNIIVEEKWLNKTTRVLIKYKPKEGTFTKF